MSNTPKTDKEVIDDLIKQIEKQDKKRRAEKEAKRKADVEIAMLKHLSFAQRLKYKFYKAIKPLYWSLHNQFLNLSNKIEKMENKALAEKMYAEREERRKEQAARYLADLQARQNSCSHLKGVGSWRGRVSGGYRDYNLSHFTYIDGSVEIKCLMCGKKWTPDKPDWKEAVEMFRQSTNTPNSSERIIPEHPADQNFTIAEFSKRRQVGDRWFTKEEMQQRSSVTYHDSYGVAYQDRYDLPKEPESRLVVATRISKNGEATEVATPFTEKRSEEHRTPMNAIIEIPNET